MEYYKFLKCISSDNIAAMFAYQNKECPKLTTMDTRTYACGVRRLVFAHLCKCYFEHKLTREAFSSFVWQLRIAMDVEPTQIFVRVSSGFWAM